jgi:hypothetical protein
VAARAVVASVVVKIVSIALVDASTGESVVIIHGWNFTDARTIPIGWEKINREKNEAEYQAALHFCCF